MGVHGLWKLLEAAGKPVPLETLENKVLAVDVSIWLHQMMKGFQDSRGAPVPNAHLLGLFHRVCKLLFYRIKPVFVFDGGVPLLKKQTIAARKNQKMQASKNAADAREKLLKNLVKRKAVRQLLQGPKASGEVTVDTASQDDIFHLPPMPEESINSDSEDEPADRLPTLMETNSDSEPETKPSSQLLHGLKMDLHSLDVNSEEFLSLPPDVRHDILSDLKETRKQNSWGRIHELPEDSGDFSCYQLGRLLKRRSVQVSLEKAEKEMGGKVLRMNELQELMEAQGVNIIENQGLMDSASQRIASDSATRYVLCKEPVSSQSSGSSQTKSDMTKIEDSSFYDEQVEFIAQMAENMLQQLHKTNEDKHVPLDKKKKQGHAVEHASSKLLEKEKSVFDNIDKNRDKIMADSWSSDEDASVEKEPCMTSSQASSQVEDAAEDFGLSTHKSQADDYSATYSLSKTPKFDLGNSNSSSETPASCRLHHSSCSSPEDFPSEPADVSESSSSNDLTVLSSVGISFNSEEESEVMESGKESSIVVKSSKISKEEKTKHVPEKIENVTSEIAQNQSMKTPDIGKEGIAGKAKTIELVLHPEERPEDDLFADVFSGNQLQSPKEIHKTCRLKQKVPLEIVIHPSIKPDDDDIFADIFENDEKNDISEPIKVEVFSESESESLDKCIITEKVLRNVEVGTVSSPIFVENMKETIEEETETVKTDTPGIQSIHSKSPPHNFNIENHLNSAESGSFISSVLSSASTSTSNLNQVQASLEAEQLDLQKERGRQERLAASITDQMCIEAQELLQLFGLPYVIAPMEAEAQCAFLDAISLTEGSITDDSDIWLFGGKKVYKNFFNQKKHVLQFTSSNINHYFKLSREQLVQLALLVGSDYTCGIQGVGPVTALEIVAAFHTNPESDPVQSTVKGLSRFKDWWTSGRPHKSNRLRLLDKKLKNINFSDGFPSKAVIEAYLHPSVEDSHETFSWGALDLPALREYARSKFGWPVSKTDEIILPVSKRWTARNSQRSIDSYFNFQPHLVEGLNKMSKRVQTAVNLMEVDADSDNVDDPEPIVTTSNRKRKGKKNSVSSSGEAAVKRQRRSAKQSSDSELDNEVLRVGAKLKDEGDRPLPVRAPTVPRERSSTGVKRVGRKLVEFEERKETNKNLRTDVRDCERKTHQMRGESFEHPSSDGESELQGHDAQQGPLNRKSKKVCQEYSIKDPQPAQQRSSKGIQRFGIKSDEFNSDCTSLDRNMKPKAASKKTRKAFKVTPKVSSGSDFSDVIDQVATEEKEYLMTQRSTKKQKTAEKQFFSADDSLNAPSCSYSKDQVEEEALSEDLTALTEMNWEDDPWSMEVAGQSCSKESRPKIYFGGIRANKPKKNVRHTQVNSVETHDTRGVRPGWVTRERLESRTAWVESMHRKKEDAIPQRQQDLKAMEEAKMKAISIVKATEARQASRLLGRNLSKRGKGKRRPTGKILPEHNLSESSSD